MKKEGYDSPSQSIQLRNTRFNELSVAWDCSSSMDNKAERTIVLNHTADTKDRSNHSHIVLDYEAAKKLHDFLKAYIDDTYIYHEGKK